MADMKKVWIARVELPRKLQDPVKKAAKARGMTLQGLLVHAIELVLEERKAA